MNKRVLGKNGPQISEVGLGCWQLGSDWGDGIAESKAMDILQEAVDHGINFFDTADVYGNGRSEKLIGSFLRGQNNVRVATKFGRGSDVFPNNYTKESLKAAIHSSCKRLGTESLDLLQLHCIPTEQLKRGEIFDWLRDVKREGLIQSFGASVETVEEGLICLEQEGIQSLQIIFKLIRQKPLDELIPKAYEKGVGIIVRLPLASGLLTGKFSVDTQFTSKDHRNYNRDGAAFNVGETFAGIPFEKGLQLSDTIKEQYLPENLNMVQLSLRWLLDHKAVTTIIPGASSTQQVKSNTAVSVLPPLGSMLHHELSAFYKKEVHDHIRGAY